MTAPETIWAYSPENGTHAVYPLVSKSVQYTHTDTIPDPMQDPRVMALVEAAILGAQLRLLENGRLDTPDQIRAAALSTLKKEPPDDH